MIGVIVKFKIKPGQGLAFENHIAGMSRAVENEPGNVFYRAYRTGDPTEFLLLEAYQDKAALEAHTKAPHVLATRERLAALKASDSQIDIFEQVW